LRALLAKSRLRLWLGLALIASLLSIWFRISTALSEIVVGTIAQWIIGAAIGSALLGTDESWVRFLSGIGAIVLTFLAGAELDPVVFGLKWKEAVAVGFASFFVPFLGCAAAAHYLLGWGGHAGLARRGSYVDDFGRSRLCRDDRVRLQYD
jgi:glutathione-regulated potassium-efflux system ancillary protein KefC